MHLRTYICTVIDRSATHLARKFVVLIAIHSIVDPYGGMSRHCIHAPFSKLDRINSGVELLFKCEARCGSHAKFRGNFTEK